MWIETENTEYGKLSQERKITGKFSKGKIPKMLLFYFKFKNWQYHWRKDFNYHLVREEIWNTIAYHCQIWKTKVVPIKSLNWKVRLCVEKTHFLKVFINNKSKISKPRNILLEKEPSKTSAGKYMQK